MEQTDERLARLNSIDAVMTPDSKPFLSIVVPFHNSAQKCGPLLQTLARLQPEQGAEIILVDDGSTDSTRERLREFADNSPASVILIEQDRRGPGGARNAGLDRATGNFVWFVDSDDNIDLGAIAVAKEAGASTVDLIAWEWKHPTIRRPIPPGTHAREGAAAPYPFDPIVANWYSLEFLQRTGLRFPEYCVYEATPVEEFALPLIVSTYVKSQFSAYDANIDVPSITRGVNPSHFDRLQTICLGMELVQRAGVADSVRERFETTFIQLFLWFTIRISRLPGPSWITAMRVMRQFRDEARRFGISADPFACYPGRAASKAVLRRLWRVSAALPPQSAYFDKLHMREWGRPISWAPPRLPATN